MLTDAQGFRVTTDSSATIAAINTFIDEFLRYGNQAEATILNAIAADPTCAIAHAYAAAYYLSLENAIGWQQATPYLQAANQHLNAATERERLYILAISAWATGAVQQAIAIHEVIAEKFPRDLVSVQQGQYHYFYLGDKAKLLHIAEKVLPVNRDRHYLPGMIAFGLEQCHRLAEAEALAREAVAANRRDPWAHHAIAHVLETQARVKEGIAWMEHFADTWQDCNSMLYTHNWWHIALYYLALGDTQTVLSLYDAHIWGRAHKASPKDQVGAISLLWRLELKGISVGEARWQNLASYLLPRIHEHALAFQDLHYVYALARAGQTDRVDEMLASMEAYAETIELSRQVAWVGVAIPAAKGIAAYARGDWQTTIAHLQPVMPQLWAIGGSHAQRDLFQQVYLDACQKTSSVIPSTTHSVNAAFVFR